MLRVRCNVNIFKLTSRALSINREVYDQAYLIKKNWTDKQLR